MGGKGGLRVMALSHIVGVCQLWFLYIFSVCLNPLRLLNSHRK